ncbi:hypothetical protein [Streptomyces broussonetiae]|uniref:Uncharacterized protein n=1 Tax=Streptomyces broussonetiae TaxID=2686304 RepID=A0A6I6MVN8_9ACTN|nr:hypothetical protein [Streptomyces broussonetiae]QHA04443.1 hypothetical protein GQF42_15150 [Streptomyces broussonetiae]
MAGDPVPHLPPLLEAVLGVGSAPENATATLGDGRAAVRQTAHDDGAAGADGEGTTVTWQAPL